MTSPEFRQVPGFEGYSVSQDGDMINSSGRFMTKTKTSKGYFTFSLQQFGGPKRLLAHRAVALAWIGLPPDGKPCVAHLDNVRTNNHVSNLAWVSYKENESHKKLHGTLNRGEDRPASKLTEVDVVRLRKLNALGINSSDLSRVFGVSRKLVSDVLLGRAWKHVPLDNGENALRGGE